VSIKIIVEGGGEGGTSVRECRRGFEVFFGKMLQGRDKASITPGGGRNESFKLFRATLPILGKGDHVVLLVDSEGPIPASDDPWEYVRLRPGDGWLRPDLATADNLHFMVQCIEAWFLSDISKLSSYYGSEFKPDKLPKPVNGKDVEQHSKDSIFKGFKAAVKPCDLDGYAKSDAFEIIKLIDPDKVCKVSYFARRLKDHLHAISPLRD
jgi:hypothetical protein